MFGSMLILFARSSPQKTTAARNQAARPKRRGSNFFARLPLCLFDFKGSPGFERVNPTDARISIYQ